MNTIDDLLRDNFYMHGSTQLDHFITAKAGGTPYGMYKQAIRELDVRHRALNELLADREILLVTIEELDRCIESATVFRNGESVKASHFDVRRMAVDVDRKRKALPHAAQSIFDHERERDRFRDQALHLRSILSTRGITFPLSQEWRDILEREMWIFLLKRDAAMEFLCGGGIQKNTLSLVMSLPHDNRMPIIETIREQVHHVQATGRMEGGPLLDWYFSHEPPRLPGEPCSESSNGPLPSPNSSPTDAISSVESSLKIA